MSAVARALPVSGRTDRIASLAARALRACAPETKCPRFVAALRAALWEEPPPFGTDVYADLYRTASTDPQWLAMSLIAEVQRAADDAAQAWTFAKNSTDRRERQVLKRHAVDASGHVLTCVAILDMSFPGAIEPAFRAQLNALCPGYSARQRLPVGGEAAGADACVRALIRVNTAAMRNVIRAEIRRPALAGQSAKANRRRVVGDWDSVLSDLERHVAETAALIDRRAARDARLDLAGLFCRELRAFERATADEPIEFSYRQRFGIYL